MYKVLAILVVSVFTLSHTAVGLAYSSTRSSVRSYSAPRSYSRPRGYNQLINTSRPTPKAWSKTAKYGSSRATLAGRRPLSSRTPAPKPHTFNGRTYQSSKAIYTNTSGNWVLYFVTGALVGNAIGDHSKEIHCFDEKHKEVKCDRDDKSYQKDW